MRKRADSDAGGHSDIDTVTISDFDLAALVATSSSSESPIIQGLAKGSDDAVVVDVFDPGAIEIAETSFATRGGHGGAPSNAKAARATKPTRVGNYGQRAPKRSAAGTISLLDNTSDFSEGFSI